MAAAAGDGRHGEVSRWRLPPYVACTHNANVISGAGRCRRLQTYGACNNAAVSLRLFTLMVSAQAVDARGAVARTDTESNHA
jgi:hypothetical protein